MKHVSAIALAALVAGMAGCNRESPTGPQAAPTNLDKTPIASASVVCAFQGRDGEQPERVARSGTIVNLTPVGRPIWKPQDLHVFSAPIGTPADGFAEFFTTSAAVLPPPNHVPNPALGIGPGAPHCPPLTPYNQEIATGVAKLGFDEGHRFTVSEFTNGNGIWLVWMTVPNPGTTGSSPDFASGPIIPNTLFPIAITGVLNHNGSVFDPAAANFSVPKLDNTLTPPFNVDGHSHFPFFVAETDLFGPPGASLVGGYEFRLQMIDQQGNGWKIGVKFDVGTAAAT